jgi:tetratricopeptide (TPR) repeat protein
LKCFKKYSFFLFLFVIYSCSPVEQEEPAFKPSTKVDPSTSLDCSGIWSESQLCLERNEALVELRKFDQLYKSVESVVGGRNNELIEKLKLVRQEGDSHYTDEFYFKARDSYISGIKLIEEFNKKESIFVGNLILQIKNNLKLGRIQESNILLEELLARSKTSEAKLLQNRIDNYYQINDLMDESRSLLSNNDYEKALESINLAISLDAERLDSKQLKDEIEIKSNFYYFDLYLESSYRELSNNNINDAFDYFNSAKKIFSNNEELFILSKALQKYKKEYDLTRFIKLGDSFYNQEVWGKAILNYKSALELSPNSSNILNKLKRTESLNTINQRLNKFMDSPERLSSKRIRDSFLNTINEGLSFSLESEKNLILSLDKAKDIYKQYSVMIALNLSSNNKTFVDIVKTVQYQPFENESIKLYPGNYVIVAKKKGLQAYRFSINISPDSDVININAICDSVCSVFYDDEPPLENSITKNQTEINTPIAISSGESNFIKGAKIIRSTFSNNLVCDRPTKNNTIKISFSLAVDRSGNVISLQILGEYKFSSEDRKAISVVERALRKSRFRLPVVNGSKQSGKIKHTVSIPQNFCEK